MEGQYVRPGGNYEVSFKVHETVYVTAVCLGFLAGGARV